MKPQIFSIARHAIAATGSIIFVSLFPLILYVALIFATGDVGGPLNLVIVPFGNFVFAIVLTLLVFLPTCLIIEYLLKKRSSSRWLQFSTNMGCLLLGGGFGLIVFLFSILIGAIYDIVPLDNSITAIFLGGSFYTMFCGGVPLLFGGVIYWSLLRMGDILIDRFGLVVAA